MSIEKPYVPSPEEVKKAEEMMTDEEIKMSEMRVNEEIAGIVNEDSRGNEVFSLIRGEVSKAHLDCYSGPDGIKKISLSPGTLEAINAQAERVKFNNEELVKFYEGIVLYNVKQLI